MSQTFTLPITASDQFIHGHENRKASTRRHSRLALPFNLPRIPSGEVPSLEDVPLNSQYDRPKHNHNYSISSISSSESLKAPSYDVNAPLLVNKKRSFDMVSAHQAGSAKMAAPHNHVHSRVSRVTRILLDATESYPLLHGILADHDSRRIFYFMFLNLGFMGVQSAYGFLTGSLGLISDSIHMFFDCVALFVGVCAAVMSKWPPSAKFPYGYGKIDTLAGLGNGIFLMLISVEIVYEAVERLFTGSEVSRTTELLLVSLAGFAVNMVGIMAFHGHHGHSHGHDHGHSHSHSHDHSHSHSHDSSSPNRASVAAHSHGGHSHHGDNMQGIYLHIMADALGSVAVVISTILVQLTGWSGFDPLASCMIAVLIFVSTVPLVSSTIRILLLSLNDDVEYNLRDTLGGITDIRGVVGYTVPKFWLQDVKKPDAHDHSHGDEHSHCSSHEKKVSGDISAHHHDHNHDHSRGHSHDQHHDSQSHSRNHTRDHSHQHSTSPVADAQVLGVIHIQISSTATLEDVQPRIARYFAERQMDVTVQYEREGENRCWCTGNSAPTAATNGNVHKKLSHGSLGYEFGKKP